MAQEMRRLEHGVVGQLRSVGRGGGSRLRLSVTGFADGSTLRFDHRPT
jgi:hypothetical protein